MSIFKDKSIIFDLSIYIYIERERIDIDHHHTLLLTDDMHMTNQHIDVRYPVINRFRKLIEFLS
jgi:hypothetical protein